MMKTRPNITAMMKILRRNKTKVEEEEFSILGKGKSQ